MPLSDIKTSKLLRNMKYISYWNAQSETNQKSISDKIGLGGESEKDDASQSEGTEFEPLRLRSEKLRAQDQAG